MRYRYYLYHPDLKQPVLIHEPVGWDSLNKILSRQTVTRDKNAWAHGILFEYTTSLRFIKDGKTIIHTLYELYGPETEIQVYIDKQNTQTRKWERDFTGRLNLMTLKISKLYAECMVENTGFVQKFKNRSAIKVNINSLTNLDGGSITPFTNERIDLTLHSKTFKREFESSSSPAGASALMPIEQIIAEEYNGPMYVMVGLLPTKQEIDNFLHFGLSVSLQNPETTSKYIFKVAEAGQYTFNIDLNVRALYDGETVLQWSMKWYLKYGRPTNYTTVEIGSVTDDQNSSSPLILNETYQASVALEADDEIYFWGALENGGSWVGVGNSGDVIFFDTRIEGPANIPTIFNLSADTTTPATDTKAVLIHEAAARISQAITGREDAFRSDFYGRTDSEPNTYASDGEGSLRALLPGFWVRGFPATDKPLYLSFSELLAFASAVDGTSVGIEVIDGKEYIVLKPLEEFYQQVEILKLNNVKDIEKEVAEEFYYNEMEIGFRKWTVSGGRVNHLDEFNTIRNYSFPITQVQRKLSLVSPLIAGGYALEATRRETFAKSATKDSEYDNEVFVVQLKRNGSDFETAKNEDFTTLSGILDPATIYNADLSPARCLRRNGRSIRSFLEKQADKELIIGGTEGNIAMISRRTEETSSINEGANVPISDLDRPLWLPEIYRFKAPLTVPQMDALHSNPYGYISFSEGTTGHKRAYLLSASRDAKTRAVTFTGIKANI